ncbi:MAG: TrkA C-terminal domain-containing protein, partial [Bacteroidales bacterium]|nr:TrkA C-terminal domain-containing protein [Bacteroidales bacterium]
PVKHRKNMQLSSFVINEKSKYINQTIAESGIREQGGCMIVCLERNGEEIFNPPMSMVFQKNDLIWVVGEKNNVKNVGNN